MTQFDEQEKCYRIVFKIRRVFGVMVVKWEELLTALCSLATIGTSPRRLSTTPL